MRFADFFALALAAATASVAIARPRYDSMLTTRAEDDLSLSARELAVVDLLGREYLADAEFGLSRRDDIDVVDLLRQEYALLARGGQQTGSKQPHQKSQHDPKVQAPSAPRRIGAGAGVNYSSKKPTRRIGAGANAY